MSTKTEVTVQPAEPSAETPRQRPSGGGAAGIAGDIVAGTAASGVDHYVRTLSDEKESSVGQAARVLEEVANQKPELLSPHVERFVTLLCTEHARATSCAAHVLPTLGRVAPAKVAKHLQTMQSSFDASSEAAQEGLLRTFVALCVASVTYQKRLIAVFERALQHADAKVLPRWTQLVLPALKGEPYAQARAVVEKRLAEPELPRPSAQRIADLLGIKLRAAAK